jgi:hypothetical protein
MHLKNGRSTVNSVYAWQGTILKVMMASKAKVRFEQMAAAAAVPEIMNTSHRLIL